MKLAARSCYCAAAAVKSRNFERVAPAPYYVIIYEKVLNCVQIYAIFFLRAHCIKSTWVLNQLYNFHPFHRAHIMQYVLYIYIYMIGLEYVCALRYIV